MGLLELLQQGQTQLSAGSFPGDTPINDPQSGFIQSNLSTNTYESETIGQPNNGSALVNTLSNTALDNTEGESTTNVFSPQSNQPYPFFASGIFGYAATQFTSPYSPTGNGTQGYYWFSNINEIVNIETNPQVLTLAQTSLDNTESDSISATVNPLYIQTSYPFFVRGKWRANASQFSQLWNSEFGYALNFYSSPSFQQSTLNKTSLDNTIYESENTTYPIPNVISYPNNYVTLGNLPPQVGMGIFGFGPGQYNTNYNWAGGYYSQLNYNNVINNNLLVTYTPQSGLSINNNGTSAFIQSPPFNQTYLGNVGFPQFVTGNWGNNPNIFTQPYNTGYNYLDETPIKDPNSSQTNTLDKTSLDNTDPNNYSGIVPNSISIPNTYPSLVSGEWNGAPSQYESLYNANDTYLDSVSIQDPNSPQLPTLEETGLDLTNEEHSPTTIVPDSISYPNNYPALEGVNLGIFNGAPLQYESLYNANNTYLSNVPIESENSRQKDTVLSGETALDNTLQQSLLTTTPPNSITSPNIYPNIPQTNLGEFNGAPSQYQTLYNPNSTYLDQYNSIVNEANPQIDSLNKTGMDIEDPEYENTTFTPPLPDTITTYPAIVGVNLGVTGSEAKSFNQIYKPSNTYWNNYLTNRSLFDRILA